MPFLTGKDNVRYNESSIQGIHFWLARNFGKAARCENKECTNSNAKRFVWAKKKGYEYERNRKAFFQLCYSCHTKYDMTANWRKAIGRNTSLKLVGKVNNPWGKKGKPKL